MTLWFQLDVNVHTHPKIIAAGPEGFTLWSACIAYGREHGTDGLVPVAMIDTLTAMCKGTKARKVASQLVALGLLERTGDNYSVHDFLAHQPAAAKLEKNRADARRRQQESRDRHALRHTPSSHTEVEVELQDRKAKAKTKTATKSSPRRRFVTDLAEQLQAEHDVVFDDQPTRHESMRVLLAAALKHLPATAHHGTTMGVISDYVAQVHAVEMTAEARSHTGRLVKLHSPLAVLDAYGEALKWGAGLNGNHAQDPLAISKYAAGVLTKRAHA